MHVSHHTLQSGNQSVLKDATKVALRDIVKPHVESFDFFVHPRLVPANNAKTTSDCVNLVMLSLLAPA